MIENVNRGEIMNLLREYKKLIISQIVERTGLSRSTIYLHLSVLEASDFIKRSKDNGKRGAPVTITIDRKHFPKRELETSNFLQLLKEKGTLTKEEYKKMDAPFILGRTNAVFMGYIEEKMVLTEIGKKVLKDK